MGRYGVEKQKISHNGNQEAEKANKERGQGKI
jgi:hypothetical protein